MKNEPKNLAKIIPFPLLLPPAPTYFSGLSFLTSSKSMGSGWNEQNRKTAEVSHHFFDPFKNFIE
jgi:hypothetical protein